jgi:hypothetical protein
MKGNENGNNILTTMFVLNEYVTYLNSSYGESVLAAMTLSVAMLAQFSCVHRPSSNVPCDLVCSPACCPIMHHGYTERSFSAATCSGFEVSAKVECEIRPQASVHLLCIWPFFISYDWRISFM